jgi:ATP-dependent DNA ligase
MRSALSNHACHPRRRPPIGPGWLHEIKHDGFRILALRDTAGVRLYTRGGHDFTARFPLIVAAVTALPVRSCFIDGEAIVSDDSELAVFNLMRRRRSGLQAVLCAFDLLELDDEEVRQLPIEERKRLLAGLPARSPSRYCAQYAPHRRRRYRLSAGLQARLRGHSVEAARLDVPLRPLPAVGQGQESGGTGGAARGRGRVALSRPL